VWVSGALGDAALAVAARTRDPASLGLPHGAAWPDDAAARDRLDWPEPRVALGLALRGLATAAIDVSDGLLGDLGHVLARSGVGARIDADAVPCRALFGTLPVTARYALVLAGGDDYELLFTAAPADRTAVQAAGGTAGVALTRIGAITAAPGLALVDRSGAALDHAPSGYDHFAAPAASTVAAAGADPAAPAR
jgi:thiamine-monophosphate kinase